MNAVVGKVAIGLAAAGGTGYGMYTLNEFGQRNLAKKAAEFEADSQRISREWSSWKSKLDAEFPGGNLDTPADHERMRQFLRTNPAPDFVHIQHEGITQIRLYSTYVSPQADQVFSAGESAFGAIVFSAGAVLLGGFMGHAALATKGARMGTLAAAAGSGALVAFGVGGGALGVQIIRRGETKMPAPLHNALREIWGYNNPKP